MHCCIVAPDSSLSTTMLQVTSGYPYKIPLPPFTERMSFLHKEATLCKSTLSFRWKGQGLWLTWFLLWAVFPNCKSCNDLVLHQVFSVLAACKKCKRQSIILATVDSSGVNLQPEEVSAWPVRTETPCQENYLEENWKILQRNSILHPISCTTCYCSHIDPHRLP